jgi:PAS domain S-box-containing protein
MNVYFIDAGEKDHAQITEEVVKRPSDTIVIHNIALQALENLEHSLIENFERNIHSQFSNIEPNAGDVFLVDENHEISIDGRQIGQQIKALKNNAYDFKAIIDRSLNEVYIFNAENYHFEFVNEGGLGNLGYSLEEMQKMTPFDICPLMTLNDFEKVIAEPLRSGKEKKLVFDGEHQRAGKSQYPVEAHLQFMQQGDLQFFTAIVIDKTEAEALNKESSEQLKQMSAMAQNIPKGSISLIDKDFKILFTDGDGYRTHGIDPSTLAGISAKKILDGSVFEIIRKASQKFSDSDAVIFDVKFENKVYQNTLKSIFDNDQQFKYFILTVFDITELSNKTHALEVEKNKYSSIYNAISKSALVSITDAEGVIIDVNEAFCHASKYREDELIGRNHSIINSEYHSKDFWDDMWKHVKAGNTWRAEVKNKVKDGSFYWVDKVVNPILDAEGKTTSFLSINYLITEKKALEQSKEELTNRLELATKAAKMGVWSYDVETKVVFWDEKMLEIYRTKSFDGRFETFASLIHENEREQELKTLFSYIEDKNTFEYIVDSRVNTHDDEEVYVRGKALIEREKGVAKKITGVVWDRTEEKKAELQLKEQNEKLAQLESFINQSTDAIQVSDESGQLVYVNDAAAERLAIEKENVTNYHVSDFELLFKEELAWKNHIKELKAKRTLTIESENLNQRTKEPFPVEVTVTLKNINGENYVIANSRDITDRKKAEEELKASEERFRFIAENTSDGIMVFEDDHISYSSLAYDTILGYRPEESLTHDRAFIYNAMHPEDREPIFELIDASIKNKASNISYQYRVKHKKGHYVWREDTTNFFYDDNGKLIKSILIARNITTRKKAELALQESEAKHRFLVESSQELICLHEPEGQYKFISPSITNLTGYVPKELIGKDPYDFFHPEDVKHIAEGTHKPALSGKTTPNIQYRFKKKDGTYLWLDTYTEIIKDEKGNITSLLTGSRDISEIKEAQLKLAKSEEMLSDLANNLPGLILSYVVYPDGTDQILFLSDGCRQLWEISKEDALADTNKVWAKVHQDDLDNYYKSIEKSAAELSSWNFEWRLVMDDGRVKWVSGIGKPKQLDDGSVLWHTLHLDITDKKNAELELEKTLQHLKVSIETGKMGIWELDFEEKYLDWNDQMFDIFGVDKPTFDHDVETFRKRVHPEDADYMDGVLSKLSTTDVLEDTQFRIIKPDGQVRHILVSGNALSHNEAGQIKKYIGVNIDVTHIAEYQEQLKATVAEKDALFKELHHRIKNNLQMVSSLLFIKSTMTEDMPLKRFIDETSTKIHSISSIHEQLLQMQGVDQLDVKDYLNSLCQNLVSTYSYGSSRFDLTLELQSATMEIDRVLNIGLIVNEIISNTMKYAYPDTDSGKIHVALQHKNNSSLLKVSDDGIGIPADKISTIGSSYGMQLITIFTQQIKGTLDIDNSRGTTFTIKFPTNV